MRSDYPRKFWARVEVKGLNECWPWRSRLNIWGYGDVVFEGRRSNASRVVYKLIHGKIPEGLVICHRCDNAACCNPAHLWAATQAENLRDCRDKKRQVYLYGAAHPKATAKIKEEDVRIIRELHHKKGLNQSEIARRYNLNSATVSRIVRGESWGWIV